MGPLSLDGQPIQGESACATITTTTGHVLFEIGTPPDSQVDGIRDWRDRALLRILSELKAMRRAEEAPPEDGGDTTAATDDWMETDQVAAYLKLTPKAVREGAAKGTLLGHKYPARSIRGRWRFKKDELDRGLNKRCGSPRRAAESVWN